MLRPCLSCGKPGKGTRSAECQSTRNIARGFSPCPRVHPAVDRAEQAKPPAYAMVRTGLPGCQRVAVDVDHRIPIRAGRRSTWANAQSVCRSCRRTKTAQDLKRYPIHV
jgi:5-methylcytosine-specific restriction endonuclease McrA